MGLCVLVVTASVDCIVTAPAIFASPPTHRAFAAPIPPEVIIDPVLVDVASVVDEMVAAPVNAKVELNVAAPVTANVELSVAAPVIVAVEESVAAPVTASVDCNVAAPAMLVRPPTQSALVMPTPPAVRMDPVPMDVESVESVEEMPAAKGILAVVVV